MIVTFLCYDNEKDVTMQTITGKFTTAKIMTDNVDQSTFKQVLDVCNQERFQGTNIVIMPDTHAGAGCVIGFTMPVTDFVVPNLIGVDIGCAIDGYNLGPVDSNIDLASFDRYLRNFLPSGFNVHAAAKVHKVEPIGRAATDVADRLGLKQDRLLTSLGTLGGGNHFVELGRAQNQDLWLFLHSGSRNFGLQVANYYQKKAKEFVQGARIVGVQSGLEFLYLDSVEGQGYLKDMFVAQKYAETNRDIMASILLEFFQCNVSSCKEVIKTTHNYINESDKIIRKGAVQANAGQRTVIPLNMRDGVIVATGKGNPEWNCSAPHGAGRVLARGEAKRQLDLEVFKNEMQGVWSSCVDASTIDESPMAYKPQEEILKYIGETVTVQEIVKPIYNFKASE